jgi:small subunit ribosomal protein S5
MAEEKIQKGKVKKASDTEKHASKATTATPKPSEEKVQRAPRNERPRRMRRPARREERREFDQKIISIRRVTRVVAGGRRFSFSVAIVVGDRKGKVGVGIGKASDTALAIEKAARQAKKNMITVAKTKEGSVPHDVHAKYCSSQVIILPAKGKGIVAGSSVRNVLDLAGVKDVSAKIHSRSKNKLNNAQAAIKALSQLRP